VDDQGRHIMSMPSLTKRNPDPHHRWFLTGNGAAWFEATDQRTKLPAKSWLGPPRPRCRGSGAARKSSSASGQEAELMKLDPDLLAIFKPPWRILRHGSGNYHI